MSGVLEFEALALGVSKELAADPLTTTPRLAAVAKHLPAFSYWVQPCRASSWTGRSRSVGEPSLSSATVQAANWSANECIALEVSVDGESCKTSSIVLCRAPTPSSHTSSAPVIGPAEVVLAVVAVTVGPGVLPFVVVSCPLHAAARRTRATAVAKRVGKTWLVISTVVFLPAMWEQRSESAPRFSGYRGRWVLS